MNVMIVQNVLSKHQCMNLQQFKTNKIMRNDDWRYFKAQIKKLFSNEKQKPSTAK